MSPWEFIAALGGAATWPAMVRAQPAGGQMRRVGVLMGRSERDA
jgi:hypothetical protein